MTVWFFIPFHLSLFFENSRQCILFKFTPFPQLLSDLIHPSLLIQVYVIFNFFSSFLFVIGICYSLYVKCSSLTTYLLMERTPCLLSMFWRLDRKLQACETTQRVKMLVVSLQTSVWYSEPTRYKERTLPRCSLASMGTPWHTSHTYTHM